MMSMESQVLCLYIMVSEASFWDYLSKISLFYFKLKIFSFYLNASITISHSFSSESWYYYNYKLHPSYQSIKY